MKKLVLFCLTIFMLIQIANGQPFWFNSTPDWESDALDHVSTGLGISDINQDGWDDIIVANGNDILRQPVCVYYNQGDGNFPLRPSWESSDVDYHGHVSIGDVNADGFPDVAVSVFLGPGEFFEPGGAKIYFNRNGELESEPSYRTADSSFSFSCALGDADGDGDLDLAVAGGQPYSIGLGPYQTYGRIYYNHGDSLQTRPGWKSDITMGALDVEFADFDNNGYLDLVFANHLTPNYIFLANGLGQIETMPSWSSLDASYYANSVAIAWLTHDTYPDLIISDNNQLGGRGKFKGYCFQYAPSAQTDPCWYSSTGGYGSAVITKDIDGDGLDDLLTGRWWGQVEFYPGISGDLATDPAWQSRTNSVIEAFALRDVDQDNRFHVKDVFVIDRDSIHVAYLSNRNVEKIISILLNKESITTYCTVPSQPWISLRTVMRIGDQLEIEYLASDDQDLVVSNWDRTIGNYIFYNKRTPSSVVNNRKEMSRSKTIVYPNPMNQSCCFVVDLPTIIPVELFIYNILGKQLRRFTVIPDKPGKHVIEWDGTDDDGNPVPSNVYFVRIQFADQASTGKFAVIR